MVRGAEDINQLRDAYAGLTAFEEISIQMGTYRLVWECIGEGLSGDFDPRDKYDVPMLRFSIYETERDGIEYQIDDASYCTQMPICTERDKLMIAGNYIFEYFISSINRRRDLQAISRISPDWIQNGVVIPNGR